MSALLGRIAAGAAVVPLALCGVVTPAQASPGATTITTSLGRTTLAPGGESRSALLWASFGGEPGDARVRFTVDWSGIADFADVELQGVGLIGVIVSPLSVPGGGDYVRDEPSSGPADEGCRTEGKTFVCSTYSFTGDSRPFLPLAYFGMTPKPGAAADTSGVVRVTAAVGDGPENASESVVRIGEGVDLRAFDATPIEVAPGESAEVDARVHNAGSTTAEGAVLYLGASRDLVTGTTYRNCLYGYSVSCTFDTTLRPGATYTLAEPITFRPPADAASGSRLDSQLSWSTATEWEDFLASFPAGLLTAGTKPGTGPELELIEVVAAAAAPQVDVDDTNNTGKLTLAVGGDSAADLRALGAEVTAPVGSTAKVRVSRYNAGPANLHPELFTNNRLPVELTLPSNTELAGLERGCFMTDDRHAECLTYEPLRARDRQDFTLELTVEKKHGRAGRISTPELPGEITDRDDNATTIEVTGTGDELPITGPGTIIAAIGVLAVAIGATIRRASRRRA